jgi:sortase A
VGIGDQFYLHIWGDIIAYQVDQVKVVEPDDGSDLAIIDGEDYCTLVTCTPYSINTHRLLVRGIRTEYVEEVENSKVVYQELHSGTVVKRLVDVWPWFLAAGVVVIGSEFGLMIALIRRKRRRDEDD